MPKFSIITINLNNAQGLSKTMESVFNQTLKEFEYIVIDGGSIDGSLETILQFNRLNNKRFQWISEPDTGIYNAMNKGINMATGDYLLFLNSGDWLASNNVIQRVLLHLNNDIEIVSGELELVKSITDRIKLFPPKTINLDYCINAGLTHPNTFIKRKLFDKYGYYNEQNKIISDWEFFLIACGLHTCNYKPIPVLVSCFDTSSGISNDSYVLQNETKDALRRLLPWWKKLDRLIRRK